MYEKHLSSQFDSELNRVSSNVLELGGLVEMQIRQAIYALSEFSIEVADQVEKDEQRVNALELEIDRELSNIIARRQPTAIDLRLLLAISKTTANLERVGDEAAKIARMVKRIIDSGKARMLPTGELRHAADLALAQAGTVGLTDPARLNKLAAWFDAANRTRDLLRTTVRADLAVVELLLAWGAANQQPKGNNR